MDALRVVCTALVMMAMTVAFADAQPLKAPDPAALARGRRSYILNDCYSCHGWYQVANYRFGELERAPMMGVDEGGNILGPFFRVGTECRIESKITPMPAYPRLSEAEMSDLITYIHFERRERLSGNRAAGKEYFDGVGKCGSCHKPGGLSALGPKYDTASLRQLLLGADGRGGGRSKKRLQQGQQRPTGRLWRRRRRRTSETWWFILSSSVEMKAMIGKGERIVSMSKGLAWVPIIAVTVIACSVLAQSGYGADVGAEVYAQKCALCHAGDGSGSTSMGKMLKLRDLRSPEVQAMSDAELYEITANGKAKMPAYKESLSKEQIQAVVGYIRELAKTKK